MRDPRPLSTAGLKTQKVTMQPLVRALSVLMALAHEQGGMTLRELADVLELPPSTVHRLTGVLRSEGYIIRTPTGRRFLLGRKVRALVAGTSSSYVQQAAQAELARLNRVTEEAVFVAEFVGPEVVCIAFLPGKRPLRLFVSLGTSLPLHAAASARVMLASLDDVSARSLLQGYQFKAWTPRTITDEKALLRHLEQVRARGYDIDDDEMNDSAWAVAAPVRDLTGQVRATVAVVAPVSQVHEMRRREMLRAEVLTAAEIISTELGYRPG